MTQRGFIDIITIIVIALTLTLLVGGVVATSMIPCDPKVQHCISYGSGTFEAPK